MTTAPADPVAPAAVEQLRAELTPAPAAALPRRRNARLPARLRTPIARAAKRLIRRSIAWYVDPRAEEAASNATRRMHRQLRHELADDVDEQRALAINLELIKAEVRSVEDTLDELGRAIAPAGGLAGAAERMAELRQRLNDVDRRSRRAAARSQEGGAPAADGQGPVAAAEEVSRFDYVGFERRFRGDAGAVLATQLERYLDDLRGHEPVLDIGCGRGELVGALAERGIDAQGVDLDADAVAEADAAGRRVRRADALQVLRDAAPGSFGAIVNFHLLEHLELEPMLELLELAAARLKPGGVFIAETPNPASLIVLGNSYILDPTHVRPLHPSLLVFLCERAGFSDVQLRLYAPADGYRIAPITAPDAPEWMAQVNRAFSRLNDVLFGPQEYAVVARV